MRIFPLKTYSVINNKTNKNQKTTSLNKSQELPSFRGFFDLFKRNQNLISANNACELITNAGYDREALKNSMLSFTKKEGFLRKRYYKDMIEKSLYLIKSGVSFFDMMFVPQILSRDVFFNFSDKMEKIVKMNYPKGYLNDVVKENLSLDDAKNLCDLKNEAIKHKKDLSYSYCKFNDNELTSLIMKQPKRTLNMLKLVGQKSFIHSFNDKYDNVVHYLVEFECIDENYPEYQKILELTNPTESERYLENVDKIKELKSNFTNKHDKELTNKINSLTTENREIVKNSIKDYREKLLFLQALCMLDKNKYTKIKALVNSYTHPNKANLQERLNIFNDIVTTDGNDEHCTRLNFRKSKFLVNLIASDLGFWKNYNQMLQILNSNKNKSIESIFNDMSANKKTRKQFKKLGVDYDSWTRFNPKSFIEENITLSDGSNTKIRVQKANMNDIEHSLFLGNYASCCTAVGSGPNQTSAPNYIINKMISCIEVKADKEDIGNTMCYIAEINRKPALIIDNIELKAKYRNNDEIRNTIIEYAKKMGNEIGCVNMPIYASTREHAVSMDKFVKEFKDFKIVGSNEGRKTYFDFDADFHWLDGNKVFQEDLYKIN